MLARKTHQISRARCPAIRFREMIRIKEARVLIEKEHQGRAHLNRSNHINYLASPLLERLNFSHLNRDLS